MTARFFREFKTVDVVTTVSGQRNAALRFLTARAWLGELPGDAAKLHHRQRTGISQDNGHLQDDAERVADFIGAEFREALGTVAALEQESLSLGDLPQPGLEVARLACKNKRRHPRNLGFDAFQGCLIVINRHL